MFYLNSEFIMYPKNVISFALTVRPANSGRIYLYLYANSLAASWKIGKMRKFTDYISYRKMSRYLEIDYFVIEKSTQALKKMGAIEVVETNNKGTIYKINIPEYYDNEKFEWIFKDPEESIIFSNLGNSIDDVLDSLKHMKSKIKENKIPLFKSPVLSQE
ncbi:hypothetical protein [Marinitoga sp. 38H-ov]|uniref:hypothetical protein n=1 Tax=Marinitoga sp. 38H-ov TaxID=1755814 RepID=UPI0013EAE5C4|nr:hypothetical protein [Marinitoga sp. 38H-ov]KAF2956845.1 hypothetical protein AS160_03580 [Marinitoga sp. 38H-ov]